MRKFGYFPDKFHTFSERKRLLAFWQDKKIYTIEGEVFKIESYENLKEVLYNKKIELYTEDLTFFDFFNEILEDPKAKIILSLQKNIVGFSIKIKRYTLYIGSCRAWNYHSVNFDFLRDLQKIFDIFQVGVRPAPSSVGTHYWAKFLDVYEERALTEKTKNFLKSHDIGARAEYLAPFFFKEAYEIDLNSAYLNHTRCLPSGKEIILSTENNKDSKLIHNNKFSQEAKDMATFFTCALIYVYDNKNYGIFGEKDEDGNNNWRQKEGYHVVFGWKEEFETFIKHDIGMIYKTFGYAVGFKNFSYNSTSYAKNIEKLRLKNIEDDKINKLFKLIEVASIGYHGKSSKELILTKEKEEDSFIVSFGNGLKHCEKYVKIIEKTDSPYLYHWYSYIIMKTRLQIYEKMVEEEKNGNYIIGTNFDAIYLKKEPKNIIEKLTKEMIKNKNIDIIVDETLGEFKKQKMTNMIIPFARMLISDQKNSTPGISEYKKPEYIKKIKDSFDFIEAIWEK